MEFLKEVLENVLLILGLVVVAIVTAGPIVLILTFLCQKGLWWLALIVFVLICAAFEPIKRRIFGDDDR